jgi:hypothetical protein
MAVIRLMPANFSGTCSTVQVIRAGQLLVRRVTGDVVLDRFHLDDNRVNQDLVGLSAKLMFAIMEY